MKLAHFLNLIISYFTILLCSCKVYNAKAPEEQVLILPINQSLSTLNIPISISNKYIDSLIKANVPSPLTQGNSTQSVSVLNPVTVPTVVITQEVYQYECDHIVQVLSKIPLAKSILKPVVEHVICNGLRQVNTVVNKQLIQRIQMNVPINYKAVLNDIQIDGNQNQIAVHAIIDFEVDANIDAKIIKTLIASCGNGGSMAQIEVALLANLSFQNDGKLDITNKSWSLKWNRPCNLTALDISAEDIIKLPFIKQLVENKINDLVQNKIPGQLNFEDKLKANWNKFSKNIPISNVGNLNLNISQINTESLFVSKDSIQLNFGAVCKPILNITDEKTPAVDNPFPNITNNQLPQGFDVNILGSVSLKKINEYAKLNFEKYSKQIDGKYLELESISLYQSNDQLVIEAGLKKPFKGKVYLWGKPKFDLDENAIMFENLDYTIDSKAMLGNLANWILQSEILEKIIKEKFKYKYDKNISQIVSKFSNVNQEIKNGIYLEGKLDKINPTDIIVSDNSLNLIINVSGDAIINL